MEDLGWEAYLLNLDYGNLVSVFFCLRLYCPK